MRTGNGEGENEPVAGFRPATSPVTWLLALCFLFAIDAAVTRTSLLWGPTAFENSGGIRTVFPQTYQVARKLYAPRSDGDGRIAVLGNSRIALALKEERFERVLHRVAPEVSAKISNLAVFGSFMGDTQMLARHLPALAPSLVVVTVGAADLLREPTNPGGGGPMQLLRIGWSDGPLATASFSERLDRYLRTLWPLYRFREFAREAILDRVLGRKDPGAPPETFESRDALFRHLYADRAGEVGSAYQAWERERTLSAYATYVETASPGHLARGRERSRSREELTSETPSVRVLDALVSDLVEANWPTIVLLMPENPILAEDSASEYHRADVDARAAEIVRGIASRHGVRLVDARTWLPIEAFLDFDHPILELEHFDELLSREIAAALAPGGSDAVAK